MAVIRCSIDDCNMSCKSRGWCATHYMRWRKHGDPLFTLKPRGGLTDAAKQCTSCHMWKDFTCFNKNSQSRTGLHPQCKWCKAQKAKASYDADRPAAIEKQQWRTLKSTYKITRPQFEHMLASQNGACDICCEPQPGRRLSVDHDHACCPGHGSCGKCVRALLCAKCNSLLGLANDKQQRLEEAIAYLRRWSPSQ